MDPAPVVSAIQAILLAHGSEQASECEVRAYGTCGEDAIPRLSDTTTFRVRRFE